jgi:cell wall-associated NlpC family hydrolase
MAKKAFKIVVSCVVALLLVSSNSLVFAATKTDASQKTVTTQNVAKKTKSTPTSAKKEDSKDKKSPLTSAKNTKTSKPATIASKSSNKTKTLTKKLATNKTKTTNVKTTKLASNKDTPSSTKKITNEKSDKNKDLVVALNPDKKTISKVDIKTSDSKKAEPITLAKKEDKNSNTALNKKNKDETVATTSTVKNKKTGFHAQNLHKGKRNHKSSSSYRESIKLAIADIPEESAQFAKELKHGVANLAGMVNKTLENMHYTHYQMGGSKFDQSHGIYITDCSGYVNRLLNQVNPAAYFSLVRGTGSSRPNTEDFYNFFNNLAFRSTQHWRKVDDASSLEAGDILVFRHGWHGGHVMVVMNKPIRHNDVLEVRVADSASSGHSRDTRPAHVSGIGVGTMLIKVTPGNQPAAYAWRVGAPWERVRFAMGRPLA